MNRGSQASSGLVLGVDISEAEGPITGVGRYTLDLLSAWLEQAHAGDGPVATWKLFARKREDVPEFLRKHADVVTSESSDGVVRWQQLRLPGLLREAPVDLLFCPAYAIPLRSNTPAVVALHDLSFERDPSAFSFKEAWRRRLLARQSAKRAVGVVTISEFSRSEIEAIYKIPKDQICAVYPSCDRSVFRPPSANDTASRPTLSAIFSGNEAPPFVLSVGTILNRRNLDVLLKAFADLPKEFANHHLVVVGSNQTRPRKNFEDLAGNLGVRGRSHFVEHVEQSALVALYQQTQLLVSLSEYEGFGLPVLEAVCCGAPVLALRQGVYEELWHGRLPMVETIDPDDVRSAILGAIGRKPDLESLAPFLDSSFNPAVGPAKVLKFLSQAGAHSEFHSLSR